MKSITIKTLSVLLIGTVLASCLDGNVPNTPPGGSPLFLVASFDPSRGASDPTLLYTGLQYFGNQALLLDQAAAKEKIKFAVALQGLSTFPKDINLSLVVVPDGVDDNLANDHIPYTLLNSTQYKVLNSTAVIKAGERYAEFELEFYPPNIDFKQSTILPLSVTNDAGVVISSNFGTFYPHIIGNPIAALYTWDFVRCEDVTCSAGSNPAYAFDGESTAFSPIDQTTITVPTGYYDQPNYIISFTNTNGVLSDFKAVIDPAAVNGSWATNGISIGQAPTILVENNNTKFTVHYTTASRYITDTFTKK